MKSLARYPLVLAIYPYTRGFAFVVFESPLSPFDWGLKETRGLKKEASSLRAIEHLCDRYAPEVLALQDMSETRRAPRIRRLNAAIEHVGEERGISIRVYSRTQVRAAFAPFDFKSKHMLATMIAKHIPAFERYVPPARKPWMSEDSRMGLFDAAALGLTFFIESSRGHPPP